MAARDHQKEYQELKRLILSLGWARPGSVIRRYMPCGNASCRCMASPPKLHGPYFEWSHKFKGRTRSLRLSKEQAALALAWAANYRTLKKLLRRMEKLAMNATDDLLTSARDSAP